MLRLDRLGLTQLLGRAVRRRRRCVGGLLLRLLALATEQAPAAAAVIALVIEGLFGRLFVAGGRTLGRVLGRLLRRRLLTLGGAVVIEVALLRRRCGLAAAAALLVFLDPRIDDRLQVARRVVDHGLGLGFDPRLRRACGRGFIGRSRRMLRRGVARREDANLRLTRRSRRRRARAAERLALRLDLLNDGLVHAGRHYRNADLAVQGRVEGGAEDDVGVAVHFAGDGVGGLVDFQQGHVHAAGD